ncbi:hypothetical protein EIP91_008614 [Steccherinum ochraceum]|uniref:SsuA/THI5-like domain-containing protein n=1 Tax=Steccherinum ochraceum TaxID=92696 RepID=A0A4R0RY57_9APHY|nr:hypothetical protein EIP91_008614 [Steccherinum ochraceum]
MVSARIYTLHFNDVAPYAIIDMRDLRAPFLTLLFALGISIVNAETSLDPFVYGAFTKSATFSVASQLGFLTEQGLNVTFSQVRLIVVPIGTSEMITLSQIPNSTFGYANLLAGGYDLLTGTVDNAVNLRFNSNETLSVVGQVDLGPDLVIAGIPNITSTQDLRGKPLMVDAAASGYAFVLRKILSLNGLQFGADYTFQVVGGTPTRFDFLSKGSLADGTAVFATILTYPFTALASAATPPLPILARISDFVAPFFSTALTIRTSDADPSTDPTSPIIRFVAAFLAANRFLSDPANKACVIQALAVENGITVEVADAEYAAATDPITGEVSQVDFTPSRLGLFNVIDIRMLSSGFTGAGSEFDFVSASEEGLGMLLDLRIRDAALALVKEVQSGSCPLGQT